MRRSLVLHLSDLHFGEHGRFRQIDPVVVARRCFRAIEQALQQLQINDRVCLVIVTGDVAEKGISPEYDKATAFFRALIGHLGLSCRQFVFVPGNHDVSWHKCRILEEQRDGGDISIDEYFNRLHRFKFEPFDNFVLGMLGDSRDNSMAVQLNSNYAWIHSFPELGIDVAALNSCEIETNSVHRGMFGHTQAQALLDHWGSRQADRIRIIAIHHNPIATVPDSVEEWRMWAKTKGGIPADAIDRALSDLVGFEGRDRLQRIADQCQVQFILHGHHHASSADTAWNWRTSSIVGQTHILSAGSWGLQSEKLPGDEPAVMQLLLVDGKSAQLHPILLRYEPRSEILGEVERGAFVVDTTGRNAPLSLSLPRAWVSGLKDVAPDVTTTAGRLADFLSVLRSHYHGRYVRLDLRGIGAVQGGGSGPPVAPALDDVYVPLRFASTSAMETTGGDPASRVAKGTSGTPLDLDSLLVRLESVSTNTGNSSERPMQVNGKKKAKKRKVTRGLVLVGPAGAGKTTWMRYTFRRLAEREDVVPFLVELREFARHCDDARVASDKKNIRAFLDHLVNQLNVQGWKESLEELFRSDRAPRPILLVDGWDELGDLGEPTREQLIQFLSAHPRVTAVVTSRPYGQSRPATVEGFEELYLQPLSDGDIKDLARNFHTAVHLHREQGSTVIVAIEKFEEALRGSPDAKSLARTPLLLTMMLFISRDRPLPDRRHRLYDACLEAMLSARPELKRQEGARLASIQWCPEDTAERRRATASLAAGIQEGRDTGPRHGERVAIVVTRGEAERNLPSEWSLVQRSGFIEWLIGAAGVLIDRTDDAVAFTHLSFQEYLTAWHLKSTADGASAREALCRAHQADLTWWETLRLWAAMVSDDNPRWFDEVAICLLDILPGYWLVGCMLADGSGSESSGAFDKWIEHLATSFHRRCMAMSNECARAWSVSQQSARKKRISGAPSVGYSRLSEVWEPLWKSMVGLANPASTRLDTGTFAVHGENWKSIARGRVYDWVHPGWPDGGGVNSLLRLWPSPRLSAARYVQHFLEAAPHRDTALRLIGAYSRRRDRTTPAMRQSVKWPARFLLLSGKDRLMEALSSLDATLFGRIMNSLDNLFTHDSNDRWSIQAAASRSVDEFRKRVTTYELTAEPLNLRRAYSLEAWHLFMPYNPGWGLDLSLFPSISHDRKEALAEDIAFLELSAVWASCLAAVWLLTEQGSKSDEADLMRNALTAVAAPSSKSQNRGAQRLNGSFRGDPLWPALARHTAHCGTSEDRALLNSLAQDPARCSEPLASALKYYVRGDVVFPDGSEVTLDELCDEAGVTRFPYLE